MVHAMEEIAVEFLGSDPVSGRVISSEPAADVSIIQGPRARATGSPSGSDGRLQQGRDRRSRDRASAAPYGLSYSLSAGLISARYAPNTVYEAFPLAEFFQTDAAINRGKYRGPLLTGGPGHRRRRPFHLEVRGKRRFSVRRHDHSARETYSSDKRTGVLVVYPVTGPLADTLDLSPKAEG